jgi:hypothetical protein
MRALLCLVLVAVIGGSTGCWYEDPLFCCTDLAACDREGGTGVLTPCTDPERPYCDNEGEYTDLGRTCIPDPMAQDCDEPADCPAERPVCFEERTCVQCEDAALHCSPSAPICDETTHMCLGCEDSDSCAAFPETPWCLPSSGECVACRDTPDCPSSAPICEDNVCRSCLSDGECSSNVCDEEVGVCIDEANAIYLSPTGQAEGTCTRATPCAQPPGGVRDQGADEVVE